MLPEAGEDFLGLFFLVACQDSDLVYLLIFTQEVVARFVCKFDQVNLEVMRDTRLEFLVVKVSIQVRELEPLGFKRLKVETDQFLLSLLVTSLLYLNIPIKYLLI